MLRGDFEQATDDPVTLLAGHCSLPDLHVTETLIVRWSEDDHHTWTLAIIQRR